MTNNETRETFDCAAFLAKAGLGRRVVEFETKETFFSQGDLADTVFYLQKGRARLTVVSQSGRRQPSPCFRKAILLERSLLHRSRDCVWPRRRLSTLARRE